MSGGRSRRTRRVLPWGVVIAAAIALLACAPAASAAPTTLEGATYGLMKSYLQQYDKSGFAKVVECGALPTYRAALAGVTLEVDPGSGMSATYDATTKTLTLSTDPRKVTRAHAAAMGEAVWREVTHALEDKNGDDMSNVDPLYRSRNTDYMAYVIHNALPHLVRMENRAKAGASVKELRTYWASFVQGFLWAKGLADFRGYPADGILMEKWFGFRLRPRDIEHLYLSGKAFSGKQWKNLRDAVALLAIGEPYLGGVVAYIDQIGDPGYVAGETHGLIAAKADQSREEAWSNIAYSASGATGIAMGTGQANTTTIVHQTDTIDGVLVTCTSGAAYLCENLVEGGFSDWYLPSKDELDKLYVNDEEIGGFDSHTIYWSSSEFIPIPNGGLPMPPGAWNQDFDNGHWFSTDKSHSYAHGVRAVRSF